MFFVYSLILALINQISSLTAHSGNVLEQECVNRALDGYKAMKKIQKIQLNNRLTGFYGFNASAHAVITLDISYTNVKISFLNVSFTNMLRLHASYNGLEGIDDIGIATLPSLKLLNVSHNAISRVKSHVFGHMKEIETLDLSHNCFLYFDFEREVLTHENLKELYLNNNFLHRVSCRSSFDISDIRLSLLDVSNNFLEKFDDFILEMDNLMISNNSLTTLFIYGHGKMHVEAQFNNLESFISTSEFSYLNLSHNHISNLHNVNVKIAKIFDLSHNKIVYNERVESNNEAEESSYDDVSSDYSSDEIEVIKKRLKEYFQISTTHLNLSHNEITNATILENFKDMEFVNFESNFLNYVDIEELREKYAKLKHVNLKGNPLTPFAISEMRYHNDTRFLNMHLDFDVTTEEAAKTSPPILFPTQASNELISTTASDTTTKIAETKITKEMKSKIARITTSDSQHDAAQIETNGKLFYLYPIISLTFILILILLSFRLRRKSLQAQIGNRTYHEAENYL